MSDREESRALALMVLESEQFIAKGVLEGYLKENRRFCERYLLALVLFWTRGGCMDSIG